MVQTDFKNAIDR